MYNNNNYDRNNSAIKNNINNRQLSFPPIPSMDLWQQTARIWMELCNEVAVSSQNVYNSWLDTVWRSLGAKHQQDA